MDCNSRWFWTLFLIAGHVIGSCFGHDKEICQVTLHKCFDTVTEQRLVVPESLKANVTEETLKACNGSESGGNNVFEFSLDYRNLNCLETMEFVLQSNNSNSRDRSSSSAIVQGISNGTVSMEMISNEGRDNYFTPQGYLRIGQVYHHPENYCISRITPEAVAVRTCSPSCSGKELLKQVQIRKCCPLGSVITLDPRYPRTIKCVQTSLESEGWRPFFYHRSSTFAGKFEASFFTDTIHPDYEQSWKGCAVSQILTPNERAKPSERAQIRFTESGNVFTRSSGNHDWQPQATDNQTCIDGLFDVNTRSAGQEAVNSVSNVKYKRTEDNQVFIRCIDVHPPDLTTPPVLHLIALVLSCIFLLLGFVVHALVWKKQNIHGRTVAMYSLTFFVFLSLQFSDNTMQLIKTQNGGNEILETGTVPCLLIGVFILYFYHAMFAWITVLNFDIWTTVCSMESAARKSNDSQRFLYYNAFGYGLPVILLTVSLVIEFHFGYFDDHVVRPQFGYEGCNVSTSSFLYHALTPATTFFAISICFVGFTTKFLLEYIIKSRNIQRSSQSNQSHKMTMLFGKVIVLLVISWIFEIGGTLWAFLGGGQTLWFLVLFDAHNLLQAIGFFWMFSCKKDTMDQLRTKFRILDGTFSWLDEKFSSKATKSTNTSSGGGGSKQQG